ncbi:MAG: hypothetical protein WKF87_06770 [Chryseolinea sp.]
MTRSSKVVTIASSVLGLFLLMVVWFFMSSSGELEVSIKNQSEIVREQQVTTQAFKSLSLQQHDTIGHLKGAMIILESKRVDELSKERDKIIKLENDNSVLKKRIDSLVRNQPKYDVSDVKPVN